MMIRIVAPVVAFALSGCCVAGAVIGGATHRKEPDHGHYAAAVGFVLGAVVDGMVVAAMTDLNLDVYKTTN